MADRIPIYQAHSFREGLLYLGFSPVEDYELVKAARSRGDYGTADVQSRDKATKKRLWRVHVFNPTADLGSFELVVKVASDLPPASPNAARFDLVEFENMTVLPWSDKNRPGTTNLSYSADGCTLRPRQAAGAGAKS